MASSFETTLFPIVQTINEYLSNYVLVFLLLGVGIWYTIKTHCVQVRCFKEGWNRVFGNITLNGKKGGGGMSSFQALATAIAAQVGTGIIVGVAGAILTGGPGAVFWMWVISFFGMATIYAEATLAQETRIVEPDGTIKGGPVYYITTAFKGKFGKFLAGFFAVAITLALGFMGCMVQSNSIGATMETAFGIPSWVVGIVLIVICAFIFLGGVQRLASVTEKVVPLMAAVFLFGGLIVLVVRIKYIPETFAMIFRYAFEPQAIVGGGFGYAIKLAISQGAKRGLFSNEAGMGSTPHAHALANVKNPHEQGTVAIIGVFIDMFVILTLNALVIISTLYAGDGPLAGCGAAALSSTFNKTNLAQCAFGTVFGYKAGSMFVAICLFFFAFSTILSWNLFGKINMVYLFGKKSANVYTLLALIFIFLGTTGVVVPYSCSAWIDSIRRGVDVARAAGLTHLAGCTGSTSERVATELFGLPELALLDMGDFAGAVLKYVSRHPVERLTLVGGFAKLSKLAAGHLDLHSHRTAVDPTHLAALAASAGASPELVAEVLGSNTAMGALQACHAAGIPLGNAVAEAARDVAARVLREAPVAVAIVCIDRAGAVVGSTT